MSRATFSSSMGCSWPKICGFWGIPGGGGGEKTHKAVSRERTATAECDTHTGGLSPCPTQHGDQGLGRPHGHGEDGAGVLALVGQHHVADADGQLVGGGSLQLDPVIPQG